MFISVLDLFKIGIGPSSSHTVGPMVAAQAFVERIPRILGNGPPPADLRLRCTLRGSLAYTGRGHATDRAVALGLHGHSPEAVADVDMEDLVAQIWQRVTISPEGCGPIRFTPAADIVFDRGPALPEHPNGLVFELVDAAGKIIGAETYFSIGGGFIRRRAEMDRLVAPLQLAPSAACPYPFDSAKAMLEMAADSGHSIAEMKMANEAEFCSTATVEAGLDALWRAMQRCVRNGLAAAGPLPGGLKLPRRARRLYHSMEDQPDRAQLSEWLCAYALAVSEENAAGHLVVTAPTNGAAGVIPALLFHAVTHEGATPTEVRDFLLTAGAIGGLIKHRSSISGAEVGCQGEVGSAAAMAAAGLCAAKGGSPRQVEKAAEMALEHHLGMTCDPVKGLVQVPCIERNAFGAVKAHTAAALALRETGDHLMPLDSCIRAMQQIGQEMSHKFKETALGGLATSLTEC
ncbi:MAG: L-serine ammonia-lyase [Desulfosarcinaceae bacterium]|nr:L-serine ammonia-lyase [Desulfosarcinaceae bacterium]